MRIGDPRPGTPGNSRSPSSTGKPWDTVKVERRILPVLMLRLLFPASAKDSLTYSKINWAGSLSDSHSNLSLVFVVHREQSFPVKGGLSHVDG
jgi:hypothetical protein